MSTLEDYSILESNSLNMNNLDTLGGELHDLVERRCVLGPCYRLFYQKPLHLVRGRGIPCSAMVICSEVFDAFADNNP